MSDNDRLAALLAELADEGWLLAGGGEVGDLASVMVAAGVTLAATPAPLDVDAPVNANAATTKANATPAPLDVLVAAKAVVDWAEMAEGGNVAAEDAMFDRLRAALNAQEADHE